jgi:hypothetical protein
MTASVGVVQIGSWRFPPAEGGEGVATVTWQGSAKLDEKESDGANDARTTFKGRQTGKAEIVFRWRGRTATGEATPTDVYAGKMLADISPRGPNAGKPFEIVAPDQEIHAAHNIIVKDLKGPIRPLGGGEVTATLSCSTWTRQKPGVATKTPQKAQPWSGTKGPSPVTLVPDPPGFGSATAPTVNP